MIILISLPLLALAPDRNRSFMREQQDVLQFTTQAVTTSRSNISRDTLNRLGLLWRNNLPEGSDGVPLVVTNVATPQGLLDLVITAQGTGRLTANNAWTGEMVWHTEPPKGPHYSTSSPAVDPTRQYVYVYGLDGYVHKHRVGDGAEVRSFGFPALITRKPDVEKGSSNIAIATARDGQTYLYMTIAAYPDPGDEGDYQGHVVGINLSNGQQRVFNALCSDRPIHFEASGGRTDCKDTQAGIWARPGVVYDSVTDRVFVTTGNGAFNAHTGGYNWGSSVVALSPDLRLDHGTPADSYTPVDYQLINDLDLDLSSTTITILPLPRDSKLPRLAIQSGKDHMLRLLNLQDLSGQGGPRHLGGELDIADLPQGGVVVTQPAAWLDPRTGKTWMYVSSHRGIAAYTLDAENLKLKLEWVSTQFPHGKSPVMLDDLVFLTSPHSIAALDARTGAVMWRDENIGDMHWQSPTIVNSVIYVCDSPGYLSAYSLVR
jgi:outer membrane protein assembly factor BamB